MLRKEGAQSQQNTHMKLIAVLCQDDLHGIIRTLNTMQRFKILD